MTKAAGVQTGVNDITPSQTSQHTVLLSSESGFQSSRCLPRTPLQNVLVFMCHDERTCVFCDPEKCLAEVWFSCSSHYGPLKPDSLMIGVFEPTLPVWQPARPPAHPSACTCVRLRAFCLAVACSRSLAFSPSPVPEFLPLFYVVCPTVICCLSSCALRGAETTVRSQNPESI